MRKMGKGKERRLTAQCEEAARAHLLHSTRTHSLLPLNNMLKAFVCATLLGFASAAGELREERREERKTRTRKKLATKKKR